jgi:adenosylcobinamide-GDP ribazoletransferase
MSRPALRESAWRRELYAFLASVMFLTRVPVPPFPFRPEHLERSGRYAALTGLLIGAVIAGAYRFFAIWLPTELAVLLSMGAGLLLTGAFHEDGFADFCDGFGGGYTRERRLEIMHDSRVGSFGAIGIAMMLAIKALALCALPPEFVPPMLLMAHSASRFCSLSLIGFLDYALDATERSKARPIASGTKFHDILISGGVAGCLMAALSPARAFAIVPILLGAFTIAFGFYLKRRIGGYTGDCLGAAQQVSELIIYLAAAAMLAPG